jgi:hypothetical protein
MRHPTEGVLRRLLDEPNGVGDGDRQHVAACPQCLGDLNEMREDATLVEAALATEVAEGGDVAAAWRRLSTAAPIAGQRGAVAPRAGRLRALVRRPAVAALAFAVVLTGASTAAASDWLQIFRTEKVAAVAFSTAELLALPDLSAYGALTTTGEPDLHPVPDAAAAEAATGIDVPEVTTLPRGVTGAPVYQVGGQVSATFTFSAERAARAAAEAGQALPPPPPGLDGSSVRLVAGPGVAQVWASSAAAPALLVARAVPPTAFSSGVPFETVRDYLLSLPGLPATVAAQLRAFAADGTTLPLPVPRDEVTTSYARCGVGRCTPSRTRRRSCSSATTEARRFPS